MKNINFIENEEVDDFAKQLEQDGFAVKVEKYFK